MTAAAIVMRRVRPAESHKNIVQVLGLRDGSEILEQPVRWYLVSEFAGDMLRRVGLRSAAGSSLLCETAKGKHNWSAVALSNPLAQEGGAY